MLVAGPWPRPTATQNGSAVMAAVRPVRSTHYILANRGTGNLAARRRSARMRLPLAQRAVGEKAL